MIKLSEIHINPSNPRIIKDGRFKKLVKSLKEFPKMMELRPIVIDDSGMILGGNMRYKALKELGYKEVPDNWVKTADQLTEDEKNGMSHRWYSDRKQTTILAFDKPNKNAEHPTMKPISLFAYLIGNSSKEGDIVVDAFGGSGTTMVACHQMRRRAYVIELDPKYCQVIIDRMKKLDPEIVILKNGVQIDENRQT